MKPEKIPSGTRARAKQRGEEKAKTQPLTGEALIALEARINEIHASLNDRISKIEASIKLLDNPHLLSLDDRVSAIESKLNEIYRRAEGVRYEVARRHVMQAMREIEAEQAK